MMHRLVVATLSLVAVASAAAAGLAPTKASQLADVTTDFGSSCPNNAHTYVLNQIHKADGTHAPFTIPPKQVFVVTSAEISYQLIPAGHRFEAALFRESPSDTGGSTLALVTFLDGVSQGAVNVALTIPSGSVVKSGTLLCVDVLDFDGGGVLIDPGVMVHGFFAKDN